MANKNRISSRNTRGGSEINWEEEPAVTEQEQQVEEQTIVEQDVVKDQNTDELGQVKVQQEEQALVKEDQTDLSETVTKNQEQEDTAILQEQQEATHEQDEGNQQQEVITQTVTVSNQVELQEQEQKAESDKKDQMLNIEDIVKPGKFGVTNSQMIPAIKLVILEESVEKLTLLRSMYLYSFENSLKYLKKSEREFIQNNLK